ncbi:AAA family ATPase [uncultured Corynebacterium sp.]|uniref:AAA family ATPase n=1 Tax=uncultured Corynebacterium sp. TaxID=159447 RepID=UPI0025DF60FE|nr:AAA family ATPase [uncultured Corynebacterium sp.]
MFLSSIELSNVRGVRHLKADALPDTGVIVIHGGNEAGKSTLLDAVKICLTEPHGSKAARPRGGFANFGAGWLKSADADAAPEITVSFHAGDYDVTIFKRFLKKPAAELTVRSPRRATLTGEAADKELGRILEESVDLSLLGALFLRQGDEGTAIAAAGLPSLTGALDAVTGAEPAEHSASGAGSVGSAEGAGDSALMLAVQREYALYFTGKSGKPTGEYSAAQSRVDAAVQAQAAAAEAMRQLEGYVEKHAQAKRTLTETEKVLPEVREEVAAKRTAAEAATAAQESLATQRTELDRAAHDVEHARAEVARRAELADVARNARAAVDELSPRVDAATTAAAEEADRRAAAAATLATAKEEREAARAVVAAARAAESAAADRAAAAELSARLTQLDALEDAVTAAGEAAAARGRVVSDADVSRAEAAAGELALATQLRAQAAAKLLFTAEPEASITVDGAAVTLPAGEETPVELAEGTVIGIGGITARFAAGAGARTDAVAREEAARSALADVLEELGCDSVEEVRARRDEHRALDEELGRARAELSGALRGDDLGELRARAKALAGAASEAESSCADDASDLPSLAEAEAALAEASDAVDRAEAELEPLRDKRAELELATLMAHRAAAGENLARAEATLASAEEDVALEELQSAESAAVAAHEELAQTVSATAARVAELAPELALKLLDGEVARETSILERQENAKKQLWSMESYIASAEGAAEALAMADAELAAAQAQLANVERRALAARRLLEVMERHRDAARQRYAEPFARKLSELARVVYGPEVYFDLDDELAVTTRTTGETTVPLADLSGGAKEQLALITRFAIAELAAGDSGEGVPIFIDDSLGSSDPQRVELMSTLVTDMGRKSQVIVLTCEPTRFERVAGRKEFDIEELKL